MLCKSICYSYLYSYQLIIFCLRAAVANRCKITELTTRQVLTHSKLLITLPVAFNLIQKFGQSLLERDDIIHCNSKCYKPLTLNFTYRIYSNINIAYVPHRIILTLSPHHCINKKLHKNFI